MSSSELLPINPKVGQRRLSLWFALAWADAAGSVRTIHCTAGRLVTLHSASSL